MRCQTPQFLAFTLVSSILLARESFDEYMFNQSQHPSMVSPWFTGPLLSPSGHVVPESHQNYEPYVYWTQNTGNYNPHWKRHSAPTFNNVLVQTTVQCGVLPRTEFDIAPQFIYNETLGEHMWRVSDLPITLAFQIYYDKFDHWIPGVKLRFAANVPLGKYDHLNPAKHGTDGAGVGTWYPSIGLVFTRLHQITGIHFLSWRFFLNYSIGTPVNVKDVSVYGGAPTRGGVQGTRGTLYPGNIFLTLLGLEYSLTQNWALALDVQYQHTNKNRFSGRSPGTTKPVAPSREFFALAPALEYNWNANLGIIAGPWFTLAGRNAQSFISYVIAINIYN